MKAFLHKVSSTELRSFAKILELPLMVTMNDKTIQKSKPVLIDDINLCLSTLTIPNRTDKINMFLQSGRMIFFPLKYHEDNTSFNNAHNWYNRVEYDDYYVYEPKNMDSMIEEFYIIKPKKSKYFIIFKKALGGTSLSLAKIGNIINSRFNVRLDPYLQIDIVKKLFFKIRNKKLKYVTAYDNGKLGIFYYSYASAKTHLNISAKISNSNKVIMKKLDNELSKDIESIDAMDVVSNPETINSTLLDYIIIDTIPEVTEGLKEVKLNFLFSKNNNTDRLLISVKQRELIIFNVDATTDDICDVVKIVKFLVP